MNRLKEIRMARGLTQPQLARLLRDYDPRIDTSMVSRFETGICLPTPEVLSGLESVLQAPDAYLLGEAEAMAVRSMRVAGGADEPSDVVKRVAECIPCGWENAVSREYLAGALGMDDRTVRQCIAIACSYGYAIVNDQDGHGYYQSENPRDIEREIKRNDSRIAHLMRRSIGLEKRLRAAREATK